MAKKNKLAQYPETLYIVREDESSGDVFYVTYTEDEFHKLPQNQELAVYTLSKVVTVQINVTIVE